MVGLAVGGYVAEFIQTPVHNALVEFYEKQAATKGRTAELEQLDEAGYTRPGDLERLQEIMSKAGMTFDEVYVDPTGASSAIAAGQGRPACRCRRRRPPTDSSTDKGLAPIFLWRPSPTIPAARLKSLEPKSPS